MNSKLNHIQNWPELAQEAEWSAAKLAKKCGVSMRKLERHFLKIMGKSPKAWLTEQRQHQADEMLRQGLPVKVIAPSLGYKGPNHFSRAFKKHSGHCPTVKSTQPSPETSRLS